MYLCDCVYLAGLGEGGGGGGGGGGEGYRMGSCEPPMIPPSLSLSPPPLLPFLFSTLSPGSLELEVLNQAVAQRGKSCLSVWNFIIFNYLDRDGSHSPSLPLPPFHLVTQTQAFLAQPRPSVCRSASFPSLCCLTLAYHAN